ncbi:hypothetical protein J6590_032599 [Homalodisca vitripennis]|nr:hypothetical protein J6590_032599 [Homalodisca vitripennis]
MIDNIGRRLQTFIRSRGGNSVAEAVTKDQDEHSGGTSPPKVELQVEGLQKSPVERARGVYPHQRERQRQRERGRVRESPQPLFRHA